MAENGEKGKILSPALITFLRRRAMELSGLLLILAGFALTAMLASGLSPSWSAFALGPANNWFGPVGATIAGGLFASLGTASIFATLIPLGWGYRLLRKQEIGHRVARLFLAPVALLLLASGIYGLSGGAASAAGGAAGVVLFGLTLPHVPPVPSVLGLGMTHYLGAGYALLGVLVWSWSATLSRRQWAVLVMPVRMLLRLAGGMAKSRRADAEETGEDAPTLELTETSEAVTETEKAAPKKRPRKAAGKKKRQEPTIIDTGGGVAEPAAGATNQGRFDFGGDGQFRLPPAKLLKAPGKAASGLSKQELEATAAQLETVLGDFSVKGEITESRYGPVVTRHDLEPAPGTKSQRVISLADDIARSMSAVSVRVAVVPGQNVIGIELPNTDRQVVVLREILDHAVWQSDGSSLPMALGKDIAGAPVIVDLAKMPHLLVAGTTG
ncbi:MAG: DNA translocase FtsK 4TM domain-containing protein, partial [Pseudomonadota bacterium]|nr:DNA translocase FtsK 4TM domain-containing protein [Pseudomonadota bacterium]